MDKAIIKYNKQYLANQEHLDDLLEKIVNDMERMILKDIATAMKNKEPMISIVDKLYRAEFWKDNQEILYGKKDVLLKQFFKVYKNDIDTLFKIYPESNFSFSALDYQMEQFDNYLKNELDILKMMKVTESQATGLVRMAQFGAITDSQDLINLIQNNLGKPISHLRTRLFTTQSTIYRKNRSNFFASIKEEGKRYIYVGVRDNLTRPFCREHLGQIKTKSEWRNLPNGQVGSAWDFGGGYNCRHYTLLVTNNWTAKEVDDLKKSFAYTK